MSDAQYSDHSDADAAHTGPIKTPGQVLIAAFLAFLVPVLVIVGLVTYVSSGAKPSGSAQDGALAGVTPDARERGLAERLRRVGAVELRDANRALATGETVFRTQCAACHGAPGLPAAPHHGDAAAWRPRIGQGYGALLAHALKGKGAMPPQAGNYADIEIGRAVVYMANAGGARFPVPER